VAADHIGLNVVGDERRPSWPVELTANILHRLGDTGWPARW